MRNKKGFSTITFVIFMSAVFSFIILSDAFSDQALYKTLESTEKHYDLFYKEKSCDALNELQILQNPDDPKSCE